ncbi:hypothetical protein Pan44_04800 [Caulifigura coniformis]|uniref:Squalene cyclase C-terminal domain-containing protein n=1 Tax=Caulifigura coniformis TaxID=2527983 RepID=A0A517S8M0_9PLAN|nr:prenyltransferase/squalene oxidase repeat-containing protein [Caulifigura coniformis]QDT52468.1 hypothetical protein Pan44_04800 [Caulifigura coniformis]
MTTRPLLLLAEIDLDAEFYKLFRLLIAICQPVLIAILCVGFVAAFIHLLTMYGTTWGNRRVSAKAMFFSIAVHICLLIGLVALMPETRRRVWASVLSDTREVRVEVSVAIDPHAPESAVPGQGGLLDRLKRPASPLNSTFARTDQTPDPFVEPPPDVQRPETSTDLPDIAPSTVAPPPVEVTPERIAATESILQEFAAATLQAPAATAVPVQPDLSRPEPQFTRSEPVNAPPTESVVVERPTSGAVERIAEPRMDAVEPRSLNEPTSEDATLVRRDNDEIARRVGIAPTAPSTTTSTGQETPEVVKPAARPAPPTLARNTVPSPVESMPVEIERPRVPVESPSADLSPSMASPVPSLSPPVSAETPFLARVESAPTDGQLPATYQMRTPNLQGQAVRQYGGTDSSEKAVTQSLAFLAKAQKEDGHWDVGFWDGGLLTKNPDGAPRVFRSVDLDTGVTALATLAFLGKLNTLSEGEYSDNVRRSTRWLIAQQKTGGFIGNDPGGGRGETVPGNMAGMYGHAMATFALAEAYAMSRDHQDARELRAAVERGIAFILAAQLEDGGWRYFQYQTQGGDMSIFGWQLMALKSAQLGGVPIPPRVRDRVVEFLKKNSRGTHGGLGAYRTTSPTTPAMTAEALYCRQILGAGRDSAASREAVEYLLSFRNLPTRQKFDLYYWYYGTLAMFQYGGEEWQQWNVRVRELLISEQVTEGPYAGSWEPRDPWSGYGGRIYTTAIATLSLEVYYRYLPLYKDTSSDAAPASPTIEPKGM